MLGKTVNRSPSKSRDRERSMDRHKNRYSEPEPVFMSDQQLGAYLNDLRSNKPSRPAPIGARPLPSTGGNGTVQSLRRNFESQGDDESGPTTTQSPIRSKSGNSPTSPGHGTSPTNSRHGYNTKSGSPTQRRFSPYSHHRKTSSTSSTNGAFPNHSAVRSLVSIASASEEDVIDSPQKSQPDTNSRKMSGSRWMEKQEARSIRLAMQELDSRGAVIDTSIGVKGNEESEVDMLAREEAEELIRTHQLGKQPPYQEDGIKGRKVRREPISDSSASSSRYPSDSSTQSNGSYTSDSPSRRRKFVTFAMPAAIVGTGAGDSQRSSSRGSDGSKSSNGSLGSSRPRSGSGSVIGNILPLHVRNPFSRARNVKLSAPPLQSSAVNEVSTTNKIDDKVSEVTGKPWFDKVEIQRNPPSQSKDPGYVTNSNSAMLNNASKMEELEDEDEFAPMKMKDGKEVRAEDIRKATSKSFKDRSPKLPTPSAISSKAGRPIVSFNKEWEPRHEDANGGTERPLRYGPTSNNQSSIPTINIMNEAKTERFAIPVVNLPEEQNSRYNSNPDINMSGLPERSKPSIPIINLPEEQYARSNSIPTIQISESSDTSRPPIPVINLPDDPVNNNQFNSIPTISVSPANPPPPSIIINAPSISVSPPSISINSVPTINVSDTSSTTTSVRPLPVPIPSKHSPRKSKGYGPPPPSAIRSAASATPSNPFSRFRSSNALCTACALPIGGRIVTAAGSRFHPDCFRCFHCSEALECVAFFPEPDAARNERLERIRARFKGHLLPQNEQRGKTEADDGDESQVRFYCHLDFHEFFSPRCKNCTTPIEGDIIVALGATWHAGHFFCAQCGDPFEATTPFVEKDGYAWCIDCHTKRFSGKCAKCKRPVSDLVVEAMGREWHEDCFCCAECKGQFEDGRYFVRHGNEDEPVCSSCEARRLKS